jgi:hypothetical protein
MESRIPRFGTWLLQFANDNTQIGDLASDFKSDCQRKDVRASSFLSPKDLAGRMSMQSACPEAFDSLIEAQELYLDTFFRISQVTEEVA